MKLIYSTVVRTPKIKPLICFTIISMVLVTIASQLEIFALGVITKGDSVVHTAKSGNFIDTVISQLSEVMPVTKSLFNLAIFLVFVALFKATTLFLFRFNTKKIAILVSKDLRLRFFEHIQTLPMSFYQKHNIGSLSSRVVNDSYVIAESINSCLVNYLQTPFTVLTTLTLCFLTSWQLSLIMFIGFPLIVFPIFFIARRIKKISREILNNQEHFLSVLIDFISGIQTVKVFSMEDFSLKKYVEQNDKLADLERRSARYDVSSRPVVHMIGMSFLATALIYGLYIQKMEISEVVFFCGLLYVFYEPIKKFAEENNRIQRGLAAAERLHEVLNQKNHQEDSKNAQTLTSFEKAIEFKDVWFKYEDQWVLKGLDLKVEKGQTVAIVGPTGAGKSTIAQLIPRLYDVNKGEITIDDTPITTLTQKSLREHIAFVPQKSFLFIDTISTNISFGKTILTEKIEAASQRAHADEFIRRLPKGYKTVLSEAGKDLSGGQQQRLTIARALVKEAPILVMDEATSSLDVVSENHIKLAIQQLKGEMTQIIIAHRLSTIEGADKIVVIDDGRKVAEGTKEELLKSCLQFQMMWQTMHQANEPVGV
ncbi:MAG: ABC transporter ATP-binding protein [Chlamydiota bacterium]|nr:ABC transporter ATP-binding protein [Chlamydiota bacterium]